MTYTAPWSVLTAVLPTLALAVTPVAEVSAAAYEIKYVQDASGVTGTIVGTAPYTAPDSFFQSGAFETFTYADVGPGAFGAGGTLTTFVDAVGYSGNFDVSLSTLVNPSGYIDPTSVSGPLAYFFDAVNIDGAYYQLPDQTAGSAVNAEIYFAGQTLSSLGIAETAPVTVTFTPVNTENFDPFSFTFEAVIPEPTTAALLGIGGVALLRRRRA